MSVHFFRFAYDIYTYICGDITIIIQMSISPLSPSKNPSQFKSIYVVQKIQENPQLAQEIVWKTRKQP